MKVRKRTRNWWKGRVLCGGLRLGKTVNPGGHGGGGGSRVLSCIIISGYVYEYT